MSESLQSPPESHEGARDYLSRYVGIPIATWGAGEVVLGAVIAMGAMLVGLIIVGAFDPMIRTPAGKDASQLVVALALGGTAVGFASSYAAGRPRDALALLGLDRFGRSAIALAVIALGTYLASAVALSPLLSPDQQDITSELGTDTGSVGSVIVAALLVVIAAPIAEEAFFRGFMFAGLRAAMPLWPAAALSGLIFGSLHLGTGDVGVAIQLAILGLILAWLYERSGTLWAPILVHMTNNTIAFVLLVTDVI